MEEREQRRTLKQWLAENARVRPVHYKDIAGALGRDPASVSASLSIEWKQAQVDKRPAYFLRVGSGLYRYNDICEGAVDEDLIAEVRDRAEEFNEVTRRDMKEAIAALDVKAFEKLAKIVLTNIRARVEEMEVIGRHENIIMMKISWRDDGGRSPVLVYAIKCELDEEIEQNTILQIRGALPIHEANQGVLITNGHVSEEATKAALGYANHDKRVSVPPIHLMDIDIMLNVLLESRTGVRTKLVEVLLLDTDFFKNL
jgi:hypothetical protein